MLKGLLQHIEARRKWNRTRRWMREHARSRCLIGLLLANGTLRKLA